jgi:argininosuccinate lyase
VTGTGRLVGELRQGTRRVIYGELSAADIDAELSVMVRIDQAHIAMLARQHLIDGPVAARLAAGIGELAAQRFRPLAGRAAPRGLYLMYEGYLIEQLGPDVGGVLQTGRSRNDLKATVTALRLSEWVLEFAGQATRLYGVLLSRARAHQRVVMPIYTHFQAAMPVTYGYYLLGIARAVGRDLQALRDATTGLGVCPLGAAAAAGTDLPIDASYTAQLLGFTSAAEHALDAVASRDVALRVLAAVTGLAVTLSRLATDLQLWSTAEFGFIAFPDRLVGGSSAMPQKRNAFLLEHVKAKPGLALGAFAAAASMMAAAPFTNSIEVGTEAVAAIWPGLRGVSDSVALCQAVVSGARPQPEVMRRRAVDGFTAATSIANRLVAAGVPFRTAHHQVGEAVRQAVAAGSDALADFGPPGWLDGTGLATADPTEVMAEHRYGGGPGAFEPAFDTACTQWADHRAWRDGWLAGLRRADALLSAAVTELTDRKGHLEGPS